MPEGSSAGTAGPADRTHPESLHVVATAGHVDHGKSTLIVRLTGMDPDRLAEEKRRGLTIDLGFAWGTLPSGREIGFVDVPGHERFVRNMLAGVGPVRLLLFVVAADEGWKPQSEEHLQIVDVLGVDGAVLALTKRDLVDEETLALAEAEVLERISGTALEGAAVIACSGETGEGVPELRSALDDMISAAPDPGRSGRLRQWIDRVFTIRGAGTVVTGTLTGGELAVGDDVELYPAGLRARVRGLQSHKHAIDIARPVSRVAVNLSGVEKADLGRGLVLGRPGTWRPTSVFEARIRPVRGSVRPLSARGAFKVYAGSAERDARIRIYGGASEEGDRGAFVRIRLSAPLVLDVHDRFVIREAGRRATVAGGEVLDPAPPTRPGGEPSRRLEGRRSIDRRDLPAVIVRERGAIRERELAMLAGLRPPEIAGAVRAGDWWVSEPALADAAESVRAFLTRFHAEHPLLEGADDGVVREEISGSLQRSGSGGSSGLADAILEHLDREGLVARSGSRVRLAEHRDGTPAGGDVDRAVRMVADGEPVPPSITQILSAGISRDALEAAIASGALVRISRDLVMTRTLVDRALETVRSAGASGVTVGSVREALGTSRRFAVPLLEHLDAMGATKRVGDLRVAR
jgi:selenocysteine-specific elongation factor